VSHRCFQSVLLHALLVEEYVGPFPEPTLFFICNLLDLRVIARNPLALLVWGRALCLDYREVMPLVGVLALMENVPVQIVHTVVLDYGGHA
jgi:hypothetical protein